MNNREKEVLEYTLEQEKEVISELKEIYSQALDDIGEKINTLMADELTQSKIYQIEYQKALKGQVSAILDNLNGEQYDSISDYLRGCYEDGFIGTLYSLQGSGVPLIIPIDQEQVVDALLLDSKISEGLYTKLGNNVSELKKSISREISRGISTAMPYADIARNLRNKGNMTINQSMNIVQTEGHRIQNRSALDSGEKAKAKGADLVKVWDSTLDSKTRPHHRALDGQVRELDENFEVDGLTADSPGHFGTPSEDCRCRCVVLIKPRWDVDGSFTKRNNETGELLEFADVKSYEEFKNKYWKTVDKSGGSNQYFRPISYDEQITQKRGDMDIIFRHLDSTVNDIYMSTGCNLSRKELHNIDTRITTALNKMSINNLENFPKIYVINHVEMQKDAIASYNAVANTMAIDEMLGKSITEIINIQKDGCCPNSEISTLVHELFHWKDAQEYQKHYGKITYENYHMYINHLNKNRKKIIDKLGINEYNINEISMYASKSFKTEDFDEVYTEYRTKELLR